MKLGAWAGLPVTASILDLLQGLAPHTEGSGMVPLDTSEWWKTGALRHGGKGIMGAEERHKEWVAGQQVQMRSADALQTSTGSLQCHLSMPGHCQSGT